MANRAVTLPVGRVMTDATFSVTLKTAVGDVLELSDRHDVNAIPVVDPEVCSAL